MFATSIRQQCGTKTSSFSHMRPLGSWISKSGNVHGNNPHPDEVGITQLIDVYSKVLGSSMIRAEEEDVIVIDSDD